jgi:hypothetical protein
VSDFRTDAMKFSYSNVNSFTNCKYGCKLTYLDVKDRGQNFYSEFGSFVHLALEKFFKGELESFELADYYKSNYSENVKSKLPKFLQNSAQGCYDKGLYFFENFTFDKDKYEILHIEDGINTEKDGIKVIVKPDLILRDKTNKKYVLYDYKTSDPYKNGKLDKKKIEEYLNQMYLYCYFMWMEKQIAIDKIMIWFIKPNEVMEFNFDPMKAQEVYEWFIDGVNNIKNEEDFEANNSNKFFCNILCSVSDFCEFKPNF